MSKEREYLGKIENIYFGTERNKMGIFFTLEGDGWGVQDSITVESLSNQDGCQNIFYRLRELFSNAEVNSIKDLKGTPVRASFEGSLLRKWEILTEVL